MRVFLLIATMIQEAFSNAKSQSRIPVSSIDKEVSRHFESGYIAADRGEVKEARVSLRNKLK